MKAERLEYQFKFNENEIKSYLIELDENAKLVPNTTITYQWTKLEFEKCKHCPLIQDQFPECPVAHNIAELAEAFKDRVSHNEIEITVKSNERSYLKRASIQEGLFSIFGLIMATSGCPHMDFFRPMARFHLPFSSTEETIVRSVSMYLLGQYFNHKKGLKADFDLEHLNALYDNVNQVNEGILARIRTIAEKDADMNAITILQSFAMLLNMALSNELSSIASLFDNAPVKA